SVYAEGNIDFKIEGNKIAVKSAGTATLAADDSTFRFNLMMLFDFPLPADINNKLVKLFIGENAGGSPGSLNNEQTKMNISELISDEKNVSKMIKSLESSGTIVPEGEFKSGFVFTDVNIAFERVRRKFISTGPINLALFNGVVVNKSFTATIVVEKRRTGDKIYIYITNDQ